MNRQTLTSLRGCLAVVPAMLLCAADAGALVLHPSADPPTLLSTPANDVIARWQSSATAVAISPAHVLLTQHQGSSVGASVRIGGVVYTVAEINVVHDSSTPSNNLDLRVARLVNANGSPAHLLSYYDIYAGSAESGKTMVIGGFGEGRGANIYATTGNPNTVVGYEWDGVQGFNRVQRWGANVVTGTLDDVQVFNNTYQNDALVAYFNSSSAGTYAEATLANGDSGGGWFVFDNGQWKLAGLSQGVQNPDMAIFSPAEYIQAIRLRSYRTDIYNLVYSLPGDANFDGKVDGTDLALLAANFGAISGKLWGDGDFSLDGAVNGTDLALLAANFGVGTSSSEVAGITLEEAYIMMQVPEPSSLVLLALGGLLISRRRR